MARLNIIEGGSKRVRDLTKEATTIGRSAECTIRIDETMASRKHCLITKKGDSYVLFDMDSRNGTKLNGRKIEKEVLKNGDEISIGSVKFVFEGGAGVQPKQGTQKATKPGAVLIGVDEEKKKIPIAGSKVVVGAGESCEVHVTGTGVAQQHAEITEEIGLYFVNDLGSEAGTIVNGKPVSRVPLYDGDHLRIGDREFVFKTL